MRGAALLLAIVVIPSDMGAHARAKTDEEREIERELEEEERERARQQAQGDINNKVERQCGGNTNCAFERKQDGSGFKMTITPDGIRDGANGVDDASTPNYNQQLAQQQQAVHAAKLEEFSDRAAESKYARKQRRKSKRMGLEAEKKSSEASCEAEAESR